MSKYERAAIFRGYNGESVGYVLLRPEILHIAEQEMIVREAFLGDTL